MAHKSFVMLAEVIEWDDEGQPIDHNTYPLTHYFPLEHRFLFRLVTDDGDVLGWGLADGEHMDALDHYMPHWGCTEIQYFNTVSDRWIAI